MKHISALQGVIEVYVFSNDGIELFAHPQPCDARIMRKIQTWVSEMEKPSLVTFVFEHQHAILHVKQKEIIFILCTIDANIGEIRSHLNP